VPGFITHSPATTAQSKCSVGEDVGNARGKNDEGWWAGIVSIEGLQGAIDLSLARGVPAIDIFAPTMTLAPLVTLYAPSASLSLLQPPVFGDDTLG
jgi:hypothetical protein